MQFCLTEQLQVQFRSETFPSSLSLPAFDTINLADTSVTRITHENLNELLKKNDVVVIDLREKLLFEGDPIINGSHSVPGNYHFISN